MSLSGNLHTMALPDLLQWISAAAKTGVLSFNRGGVSKKIFTVDGTIVGSSSSDPIDYIGQWLVSCGRITEDQLRIALGEQERSNSFLGTVLVQMKALTGDELSRMLVLKTEEIIYGLFHWDDSEFEFTEGEFDTLPFTISLRVEDVLLKGVRRYDEIQRIRRVFRDSSIVLRRTQLTPPPEVLQNPHARRILDSIDGQRSIASIAFQTHASEFIVSKFLFELHQACYAEIVENVAGASPQAHEATGTAAARASSNGFLSAARTLVEAGDMEAALTVLAKAPENEREVRAYREEIEAKLVTRIYEHEITPGAIPVLARPMAEMTGESLSAEECYLLSRMDGAWSVQAIVSISPLREVEALRTLNRLRDRGLIRIE